MSFNRDPVKVIAITIKNVSTDINTSNIGTRLTVGAGVARWRERKAIARGEGVRSLTAKPV
jgi:hypothetical protein